MYKLDERTIHMTIREPTKNKAHVVHTAECIDVCFFLAYLYFFRKEKGHGKLSRTKNAGMKDRSEKSL